MSNEIQFDSSIKEENKGDSTHEIQEDNDEDIMEKINKQIEFLKNKFEVTKMVDIEERQENNIQILSNQEYEKENNNDIIKYIKEEK